MGWCNCCSRFRRCCRTQCTAPTITDVQPDAGTVSGSQLVVITGTCLSKITTVTFGTGEATILTTAPGRIVLLTPKGTATGLVDVTVSGTQGSVTATDAYTYTQADVPTLTSITPACGPTTGGTPVLIKGTHLTGASIVTLCSPLASYTVVDASTITGVIRAHAPAGVCDLTVTTPEGSDTLTGAFTYVDAPTLASIAPTEGPVGGGTAYTLTGTGLSGVTAVLFGAVEAMVATTEDTKITGTTPAHAQGAVDVTVASPVCAAASAVLKAAYSFRAVPTLTDVNPSTGPERGGNTVTLTGTNFVIDIGGAMAHQTTVTVNGTALADGDYTVDSATKITVTNWPAGTGAVDVKVSTAGGESAAKTYTYGATPTITTVDPSSGPTAGGGTVVITGTNIDDTTVVTVDGTAVATGSVTIDKTNQTVTVNPWPAGSSAKAVNVTITTTAGGVSANGTYTYVDAPTLVTVDPATGPAAGGNTVTLTGTKFVAD